MVVERMALKEIKNEEWIEKKGDKFRYSQERIVELDAQDFLQLSTRERVKIDEATKQISAAKQTQKRANEFLTKNKKLIELAEKQEKERFCEKCGMDFTLEANKDQRSGKTKSPYNTLCKNCATKEGV